MSKNPKQEINYLYFGFFLLVVSVLSGSYFFKEWTPASLYFLLYAVGQSLLEVSLFLFLTSLLKSYAPRWIFNFFIALSFIALLAHYNDYIMLRLMDVSISYVFNFFFGSGIDHLIVGFLAMNLNPIIVGMIFGALIVIPLLGIGFYRMTERWTRRRPWTLSLGQMGAILISVSGALFVSDFFASFSIDPSAYNKYERGLPLGTTFLSPKKAYYHLPKPLSPLQDEAKVQDQLASIAPSKDPLPNIYFFIIETFRRDFTGGDIAPNLASFTEQNVTFKETFANANYTCLSWFALLNSGFPYHWTEARDQWKHGSVPLQILKKMGYKIRVYSSADLRYFHIDQVLFGKDRKLIDHVEEYTLNRDITPAKRDALAIDSFQRDIDEHSQGTVFFFFLDSTHSEYSIPKDWPLKFTPVSDTISYLTISPGSDLEKLKNRYRNSIQYVDSLLGRFFTTLKEKNLYEDSIVAITGDHGEEFFEDGALFHGSHLSSYQTNVPIVCKFQENGWRDLIDPARSCMTHIDIFPSILHYLTKTNSFSNLFDGSSIFEKMEWPYHIAVLQNGSKAPVEFTLENGSEKISARLIDSETIEVLEANALTFPGAFDGMSR